MRQGADRAPLKERKDDLYETVRPAIDTLLRLEKLPKYIWEPCAGRGAISRVLLEAGHLVCAQDLVAYRGADGGIETPVDFLMELKAPAGCDMIVTNPPFKLADDFIRHGLSLVRYIWVLQRLMAIEGANRWDIIDRHLVRVWAGIERLPTMHRENWTGPRQSKAGAPFGWFLFSSELTSGEFTVRRMSWRGP